MPDVLEVEKPTVTIDSFDGSPIPPEERVSDVPEQKKAEAPIVEEKKIEQPPIEETKIEVEEKKDEPIFEVKKEVVAELPKYANADSEKIHKLLLDGKNDEVADIIIEQRRLNKLITGETTKESAAQILKLKLEKTYAGLKPDQIEYKFNKLYAMPKEPVQKAIEDEDEFKERHDEWKLALQNAENDLLIDAEMAKPELEKFKLDIQLPNISGNENAKPPTQEELAKAQKDAEQFLVQAEETINKFEGFNVSYKDKDVDVQSTYALSAEEKQNVLGKLKTLADENYNANAIFAERWVNDDGTFNHNQMVKDLAALETDEKRSTKYVSDATAKAKLAFIKNKANITLGTETGGQMQLDDKTTQQKNEDAIWSVGA